ncbi:MULTISPECIES: hypothetical protein [Pantoea]|uniref:hypothetical protein n=1 Tax=Pantoea TaxID=53335 RepID=UPI0018CC895B|nr:MULTISPECIES: hypothetical protein [Pantoea]
MEMIVSLFIPGAHNAAIFPDHGIATLPGYQLCLTTLPTPYVVSSVFFLKPCVAGAGPG